MKNLIKAIDDEDFDLAKRLINHSNINKVNIDGFSVLMKCCTTSCNTNHQKLIHLLLDNNADVNIRDNKYKTNALMYLLELDRPEVTKKIILLTNLFVKNSDEIYALTLAIIHDKLQAVEWICQTVKSQQQINEFRTHLIYPNHGLTPHAHQFPDAIELYLKLDSTLKQKETFQKRLKL